MASIHPSINAKPKPGFCRCLPSLRSCYPAFVKRRIQARKEQKEARDSDEVLMHLPYGLDKFGKEIFVEILQIGIKESFTTQEIRTGKAVSVSIQHEGNGRKVIWGNANAPLYARFGKSFVEDVRMVNRTINFDSEDETTRSTLRQMHSLAPTPEATKPDAAASAAASAASAKAIAATAVSTAAAVAKVYHDNTVKTLTEPCKLSNSAVSVAVPRSAAPAAAPAKRVVDARKVFYSHSAASPTAKGHMEAFIAGTLFDPKGKLPNERAGFRIVSAEELHGELKVKTWWPSTVWYAKQNKGMGNYVVVARHSLIALNTAVDNGYDLRVVTDSKTTDVGVYGRDNRKDKTDKAAVLPSFDMAKAKCLADALPKPLIDAYYKSFGLKCAPPDPAILYDFLLVPCEWDMSVAQLRAAASCWGPALGKQVRMRAFDFFNSDRNGVTCGLIPDTPENRKRSFDHGFITSCVSNSHGGSSSIGYHGDKAVFIHLGKRNEQFNYGISGAVAQQLENYWCGRPACDATDVGFRNFQAATKRNIKSCEKIMDLYTPELVGNEPMPGVVDLFVDSLLPPKDLLPSPPKGLLQSSALEMPIGSKASNTMRHAVARSKGAEGLKRLAAKDYNKARSLVRAFKVATNASSSTMAMLYYWIDGGGEEDYSWRYTTKEEEDFKAEWNDVENEYDDWVQQAYWGGEEELPDFDYDSGPEAFIPPFQRFVRRGRDAARDEVDETALGKPEPVKHCPQRILKMTQRLMYSHQPFAEEQPLQSAPSAISSPSALAPLMEGVEAEPLSSPISSPSALAPVMEDVEAEPLSEAPGAPEPPLLETPPVPLPVDDETPHNSTMHCFKMRVDKPRLMQQQGRSPFWIPRRRKSEPESPQQQMTVTQVSEEYLQAKAYTYATNIRDCISAIEGQASDAHAFDKLMHSFIGENPEKLKRISKRDYFESCAKLDLRGIQNQSEYWQQFIAPNIVPASSVQGATKVKNMTAKARATHSGKISKFKEPVFDGLFKQFKEWNWDEETNQARGVWPPQGPGAVCESLDNTLKENTKALPLDPRTVPQLASGYPAAVMDLDEDMYSWIKRNLEDLMMEKGCGWHLPGCRSKGEFCESMTCIPTILTKLTLVLATNLEWMAQLSPWDLYQAGLVMPEILKTKGEATKRSKQQEKRWRVIWQTCITQELLCRLIHGDQNTAETAAYQNGFTHTEEFPTFGNATGMGHHTPGLHETKAALLRLIRDDVGCAADRKAWDLSITRHLWYAEGQLRAILAAAGGAPPVFQDAQLKMSMLLSAHVVQVGQFVYQVDIFGLVGSGIFSTASSNGKLNQLLALDYPIHQLPAHHIVTYSDYHRYLSLVMGDDSVMRGGYRGMEGFIKHHALRGVQVTGATKDETPGPISDMTKVPFTSHLYDLVNPHTHPGVFDNTTKLAWRLALINKVSRDQAMGVLFAVRYTPYVSVVREMLAAINPEFKDLHYEDGVGFNLDGFL